MTREERADEARENARDAERCLGCAIGLPHDSDQCDAAQDEDTE
jgi:hypothetical protein